MESIWKSLQAISRVPRRQEALGDYLARVFEDRTLLSSDLRLESMKARRGVGHMTPSDCEAAMRARDRLDRAAGRLRHIVGARQPDWTPAEELLGIVESSLDEMKRLMPESAEKWGMTPAP